MNQDQEFFLQIEACCLEALGDALILPSQRVQEAVRGQLEALGVDVEDALYQLSTMAKEQMPAPSLQARMKTNQVLVVHPELMEEMQRAIAIGEAEADYVNGLIIERVVARRYGQVASNDNVLRDPKAEIMKGYMRQGLGEFEAREGVKALTKLVDDAVAKIFGDGVAKG